MGILRSPAGCGCRATEEGGGGGRGRHPEDDASPTIRKCVQLSVRMLGYSQVLLKRNGALYLLDAVFVFGL